MRPSYRVAAREVALPTDRHAHLTVHRDLKPENVMFKSPLPDNWREASALRGESPSA